MLFWEWFWLGVVLANSGCICGQGATVWCRNPLLTPNKFTQGYLMKMKWFVANVIAVRSPDRAEHAIIWVILVGRFLHNSDCIPGQGATLWCRTPLSNSNNFTEGHLMKIKWLVADITAVGSPNTAEGAILGVILAWRCLGQFRLYLWSGCHFVI